MSYVDNFIDWGLDKIVDLFELGEDIVSSGAEAVLNAVAGSISFFLSWFYNFLFIELWGSCEKYGYKILNFFFDFADEPFDFTAIEFVVGFIFLIFVVKLTIDIISG